MEITREKIVGIVRDGLKDNSAVLAMWLEGSAASGHADEYSDIDIWLDVEDSKEQMMLNKTKEILEKIGPLDYDYQRRKHPHPKITQRFFHIKGTSEFLLIDLNVQSHSRDFFFTKNKEGEDVQVIFEKGGSLKFQEFDEEEIKKEIDEKKPDLVKLFKLTHGVDGEIARNNFLEALMYYHKFILEPLVDLLRIEHCPAKHGFYLKHIGRDLPEDIVARLEDLYKVNSVEELRQKLQKAKEWFDEIVKDVQ